MTNKDLSVVLVTGLPGTGKTTLARALAQASGAAVLSRDPLMSALMAHEFPEQGIPEAGIPDVRVLGYALQTALLDEQLAVGRSSVVECVMTREIQNSWEDLARTRGATVFAIECICSDRELHQARIERRHQEGLSEVTWEWVARASVSYRTKPHPDYVADAVEPVETHVQAVMAAMWPP